MDILGKGSLHTKGNGPYNSVKLEDGKIAVVTLPGMENFIEDKGKDYGTR